MKELPKMPYYMYVGLPLYEQKRYKRSLFTSTEQLMPEIVRIVFYYFNVDELLAYGHSQESYIVKPRYIAMYFIRERLKIPLKTIGKLFGGRDHSTVIHGVDCVKGYMQTSRDYRDMVKEIEKLLF